MTHWLQARGGKQDRSCIKPVSFSWNHRFLRDNMRSSVHLSCLLGSAIPKLTWRVMTSDSSVFKLSHCYTDAPNTHMRAFMHTCKHKQSTHVNTQHVHAHVCTHVHTCVHTHTHTANRTQFQDLIALTLSLKLGKNGFFNRNSYFPGIFEHVAFVDCSNLVFTELT